MIFSFVDFVYGFHFSSELGREGRNLAFDTRTPRDFVAAPLSVSRDLRQKGGVNRDSEDHGRFFVFGEEVGDGLDELEVEVFDSALVFFDFGGSGGLFDDRAESSFGNDEGLVVFEDVEVR